ncbi:hypothetical protein Cmtc_17420 [Cupriavidus sp. TKC]|nr:hypothetical protein Cmtc_17420 [Cupriavidus sp. TKC]
MGLVEITLDIESIAIDGETIRFDEFAAFHKTNDEQAEETVGFFFSPPYGIAVAPHFESWVTLMPSRRVVTWRGVASQRLDSGVPTPRP